MMVNFDTAIAKAYGVNAAVVLNYFSMASAHNQCEWVTESTKMIHNSLEFLSEKQIRTAINRLIAGGIIESRKLNVKNFDATLSYRIIR